VQGCVLLNLPLIYLPLDHPRRHFGLLSTGLWPVSRDGVTLKLVSCTLILSSDEFLFWRYWFSIIVAPMADVRALASWTFANLTEVQVRDAPFASWVLAWAPGSLRRGHWARAAVVCPMLDRRLPSPAPQVLQSGASYISIAHYSGRYSQLMNVRYEESGRNFTTQQQRSITQITGDIKVPPTAVFQVRCALRVSCMRAAKRASRLFSAAAPAPPVCRQESAR
jgi:hypothetical protein